MFFINRIFLTAFELIFCILKIYTSYLGLILRFYIVFTEICFIYK